MPLETLWLEDIDSHPWGIFIEAFVFIYCFSALAVVCDHYLVLSLETLCIRWGVREDVAGATFMALGSAAPEIIISSVNCIQGESDLGVGAIIGSGMLAFSVLPGLMALAAGKDLFLKRRPLARDSVTYLLALVLLTIFFSDGFVTMIEAAALFTLYIFYVLVVVLSAPARGQWQKRQRKLQYQSAVQAALASGADRTQLEDLKEKYLNEQKKKSFVEAAEEAREAELAAALANTPDKQHHRTPDKHGMRNGSNDLSSSLLHNKDIETRDFRDHMQHHNGLADPSTALTVTPADESLDATLILDPISEDEPSRLSLDLADPVLVDDPSRSLFVKVWRVWTAPLNFMFKYTCIPCHHDGPYAKYYPLTFLVSFLWVACFSFMISAVAGRWNVLSNLPLSLFGIVLVAVGAEIPDGVQSLAVARRGYGSMAVSNSCGAQITNILVGLGLPWTIANIAGLGAEVRQGFKCERGSDGVTPVDPDCQDAEDMNADGFVPWRGIQIREHRDALTAASFQFFILFSFIVLLLIHALITKSNKAVLTRRKGLYMATSYIFVMTAYCITTQLIIQPVPDGRYYAPVE